jgi:hypothetical protein
MAEVKKACPFSTGKIYDSAEPITRKGSEKRNFLLGMKSTVQPSVHFF